MSDHLLKYILSDCGCEKKNLVLSDLVLFSTVSDVGVGKGERSFLQPCNYLSPNVSVDTR